MPRSLAMVFVDFHVAFAVENDGASASTLRDGSYQIAIAGEPIDYTSNG